MGICKAFENCEIAKFVENVLYQKLESTKSSHMQARMLFMSKFCTGIINLAPYLFYLESIGAKSNLQPYWIPSFIFILHYENSSNLDQNGGFSDNFCDFVYNYSIYKVKRGAKQCFLSTNLHFMVMEKSHLWILQNIFFVILNFCVKFDIFWKTKLEVDTFRCWIHGGH